MLNKAIEVATQAHSGQVDKAGMPYIFHPLRVMLSLDGELEQICAVLHDVVEDSDMTARKLMEMGFSEEVLEVLDCLTKRLGEPYDRFIGRVLENEVACKVKLADLRDNLNPLRLKDPSAADLERAEKYRKAVMRIEEEMKRNYNDIIYGNEAVRC